MWISLLHNSGLRLRIILGSTHVGVDLHECWSNGIPYLKSNNTDWLTGSIKLGKLVNKQLTNGIVYTYVFNGGSKL